MLELVPLTGYGQLSRTIYVEVRCEQCRRRYGYALTRTVSVAPIGFLVQKAGSGRDKALAKARSILEYKLARGQEAVPCPECGWFQKRMVSLLRQQRYGRLQRLMCNQIVLYGLMGLPIALGFGVAAAFRMNPEDGGDLAVILSLLSLPVLGGLFWFLLEVQPKGYDPNATPVAERIWYGRKRSLSWEKFQELYPDEDESTE